MRQEPTKEQMRDVASENADKISIVAREGYAKCGPGFVWLQFMFVNEWILRIEFMPMAQVRKLGMRKDTMANIESIAKRCDPKVHAAILVFKGDHLQTLGLIELTETGGAPDP